MDLFELAFAAALKFFRAGCPGVDYADCADEFEAVAARREGACQYAAQTLLDAGHDPENSKVEAAIDDAAEHAMEITDAPIAVARGTASADERRQAAFFQRFNQPAKLRTKTFVTGPPRGPRGRERRPSCNERSKGSRRGADSRAGPSSGGDDPHEAGGDDPLGEHPQLAVHHRSQPGAVA